MRFSYVKEEEETEKAKVIETGKVHAKRSMSRILACSFKRSFSIVKSRHELTAESENAGDNTDEQREPEQTVEETDSLQETVSEADIQGEQSSETSSFTEEKALSEEKIESKANEMPVSAGDCKEFEYKPAALPERNRFQAGVTFVDSQGYVYAQEVKEGKNVTRDCPEENVEIHKLQYFERKPHQP